MHSFEGTIFAFIDPMTLETIAIVALFSGAVCCIFITIDLIGHPQPMGIMDLVWPLTALYAGPLALWAYYSIGRYTRYKPKSNPKKPFWQSILTGTLHCGSG